MRAAVFHAARDIRVEDVPEPSGLGPRQVLLRPLWCGVCGTDLHEFAQGPIVIPDTPHPLNGAVLPQILGHEFSAAVVETGAEVTKVQAGDRVSIMPLIVCGRCHFCVRGQNHLCTSMACTGLSSPWGGIAELAVVEEYQVSRLPESVSDVQGALVEPTSVAAYGVDRANISPGDSLLITGFGPIGALASLYAYANGAHVIVAEPNPNRAAFARSLDVGEVIDPTDGDPVEAIRELTDGIGVDAAVECSGNARALNTCIDATRSAGTVVQTGLHTGPASIEPMQVSLKDLSIVGTWCFPIWDWPRIIGLIASGRCPVERVVTAQIATEHVVAGAFEPLLDPQGREMKVMVGERR
jgi:(R,R)-butanediol dehydrogenase / meso-butanediol dehydrogenase / diacetyl reductase